MNPQITSHQKDFQDLKVCVLIPTYNNDTTLKSVIQSVLAYTDQIVIVNDGSTDNTEKILQTFSFLRVLSYQENKGKGHALKLGFRHAFNMGFDYAITMDSDGQHFAHDLPAFLAAIRNHPHSLIIGARNLMQENVPAKSSFGNRFSNFWFFVETGVRLPDTQSGYRLYPLKAAAALSYFSSKFEFEIEAPVRLSWKGVPVVSIPVSVYYPPPQERVTHFRPFKDSMRISLLNTFLTFIALFWIHPRDFCKKLASKQGRKLFYQQIFQDPKESKHTKAMSIAFGIFMGIFPVWGFQLAIGIPLAIYFKLNKALFLIAANISIFPITPLIWLLSLFTGKIVMGNFHSFDFRGSTLERFQEAGIAFFLGGAVLAIVFAILAYGLSLLMLRSGKTKEIEE